MIPEPGSSSRCSASQASRCAASGSCSTPRPQALPVQRAAQHQGASPRTRAQLLGHVRGHPRVGRRGGGQHRHARRQIGEHGAQPAVVGPEVVAPVGDAVRLVDHQQAGRGRELGQHLVAEVTDC